jgi:hypothetical protein
VNTSHRSLLCSALTLALSVSGCDMLKKKDEAAPATTAGVAVSAAAATAATSAAAPAPAAAAEITDEAIPASEDFEDEAFAKISEQTYKSDLEALQKEIEEQ